jgi:hypothetical protein
MAIRHGRIERTEPADGEYPCLFEGCARDATRIAITRNIEGSSGPLGLEIRVPYCDEHLALTKEGKTQADVEAYAPPSPPLLLDPNAGIPVLRVIGGVVAVAVLAFVYSPDTALEWFIAQAVLIVPIVVFRGSRIAALSSGAWAAFFWIPLAVAALTAVGVRVR